MIKLNHKKKTCVNKRSMYHYREKKFKHSYNESKIKHLRRSLVKFQLLITMLRARATILQSTLPIACSIEELNCTFIQLELWLLYSLIEDAENSPRSILIGS